MVDNLFFVWGVLFVFVFYCKFLIGIVFCGVVLLYLLLDFFLYYDDGCVYFWFLSNWIYESFVSYWDRGYYVNMVVFIVVVIVFGCVYLIV